ncbi:DUF429 domain-containing protein [Coraliomargarita sinensis]|uniref:DUF429 domain-containing protein n=1 Tax=Coraliomargarita sinensis TaxID=2174842 RepID=A0A317ZNA5_9BACT|nr:DUF429 domain-containing protein [Coraliomargarita sinensis]PXA05358.1 DUF429 domain-containing protein [Coraliomargarita sinensis]
MPRQTHTAVGIDGCRGGWIAAVGSPDGQITWQLERKIADILETLPPESTILVDMILGLPDRQNPIRECDRLARQLLRPHGSRVFPAPPREALAAESYPEACARARTATGKAISKQCWHLFPKIRELDAIADPRVRESHPELVFYRLNTETIVADSKKTPSGRTQRLDLLENTLPGSREAYGRALTDFPRKEVARDDLIDALALCAAATKPQDLQMIGGQRNPSIWY